LKGETWASAAERALLGSVMLDPAAYHEVAGVVDRRTFYARGHAAVWDAIAIIVNEGRVPDAVTVATKLVEQGKLDAVGGRAELDAMCSEVPPSADPAQYAQILGEKAAKRRMEVVADAVLQSVHADQSPSEVWASFETGMSQALQGGGLATGGMGQATVALEALDYLHRARSSSGLVGLATGIRSLDTMTQGLMDSAMIVVAARPGMGKSALAMQIAKTAAQQLLPRGEQVVIASLEMGRVDLFLRLLSDESGVDGTRVRSLQLSPQELVEIEDAAARLSPLPMTYLDEGVFTPATLVSRVRREHSRKPVGMVVLDYIQLMDQPRAESRQVAVADCSRALKALARTLHCPVVALSQLNRSCEARVDKRPMMSDLRDSGAIEQDADQIWFLYRPGYYSGDSSDHNAEIIVAKNRNGRTGTVDCAWQPGQTAFKEGFVP
jgi:replicative DNA helicase